MFKLLFTTAPLLASTVFAAPGLDLRQPRDNFDPDAIQPFLPLPTAATSVEVDKSKAPANSNPDQEVTEIETRDSSDNVPRSSHFNHIALDAALFKRDSAKISPADGAAPPTAVTVTTTDISVSTTTTAAAEEKYTATLESRAVSKRNVLYFTNWGIYGANYQPQQIPADQVTHLLYAFADIASDGTVKSSDTYSDLEKHYITDSWNDMGKNAYGCVKQLYILKKKNRKLKTLLSIGGWTYSYKFAPVAATSAGRMQFASTAVKLITDWGMDGIDIDWEYPANPTEANNYVLLLQEVRAALNQYATDNKLSYKFLITIAAPAGPANYNVMNLNSMNQYVDAWHLMAYDYAGSWDTTTGHQANVFLSNTNPIATKFSTEKAINDYIKAGIPANKIVMGLPLYGRSFANTAGLGKTYQGLGGGSIENGIYLFRDMPRPGAVISFDAAAGAGWTYDNTKKELVTYDSIPSAKYKASYISRRGLGGAVFWEASGDKTGSKSLVRILAERMGTAESSTNLLSYPKSQYDNIRNGMP
ncbi:Fc.00g067250.m01.CDS01 [Cosmosporella sp. VM-42]